MELRGKEGGVCGSSVLVYYAEVRKRVQNAFGEKANEIADTIAVIQSLWKEGASLLEQIDAQCK